MGPPRPLIWTAQLNRYTSLKPVARWDSLLGKKAKAAAKSRPAKGKLSVPRREAVDWEAGEVPSSPHFEPLRYALRVKHLHDFASCTRTVTPWTARAGTVTAGDASNSASCSIDFENATAESSSMSIAITVVSYCARRHEEKHKSSVDSTVPRRQRQHRFRPLTVEPEVSARKARERYSTNINATRGYPMGDTSYKAIEARDAEQAPIMGGIKHPGRANKRCNTKTRQHWSKRAKR
ncbi:hypothetical protein DVH05_003893 [Phytophthora capsici]|nr:hypothetical protein DVH05_003893 [Phytophthora capsici]